MREIVMSVRELKEVLAHVPDSWTAVVEQPEGDCYDTEGARREERKSKLVI